MAGNEQKDTRRGVILGIGIFIEKPKPSSVTTGMKTQGKDKPERCPELLIMNTS
jgi:hypothetical protein